MTSRVARGMVAGAAFLGSVGATLALAAPAAACSCGRPDVGAALAAGKTLAVVTRTDPGTGEYPSRREGRTAVYRVEHSAGPSPPAELRGHMGGECQPYVAPGSLAALLFHREDGEWALDACAEADLGAALERVTGAPAAAGGGRPVAYAAGAFGGSRVAAVDAAGATVAYDGQPGGGERVAVCSGGRAVVAFGRTEAAEWSARVPQLTVHDAHDLRVLRTVDLPLMTHEHIVALRCGDAEGERADILMFDAGGGPGRLFAVDGAEVTGRTVGTVAASGAAVADGFVAVVDGALTRIRPGAPEEVAPLAGLEVDGALAVSPDERTVAVLGYRPEGAGHALLTFDLGSGEKLGEWAAGRDFVGGMAWLAPDRLLVRHEEHGREVPLRMRVFGRALAPGADWPSGAGEWGGSLAAVGGSAVVYGDGARLAVVPESGAPLVAGALRLAVAAHLAAVPGAAFAPGPAGPAAAVPVASSEKFTYVGPDVTPDGGGGPVEVLVGGGAFGVMFAAALLVVVRRRRRLA